MLYAIRMPKVRVFKAQCFLDSSAAKRLSQNTAQAWTDHHAERTTRCRVCTDVFLGDAGQYVG